MLTLIIETSGEKGGLILAKQGQCIASRTLLGGPELSQSLAQEVKDLLAGASPKLIAVGIGPGSYTGIRVGAALAKALAYGWKIPCLGFCSLRAFGLPPILVDARGGGIYALLEGGKAALLTPDEINLMPGIPFFRSPHPDRVQKRLNPDLRVIECDFDVKFLARDIWEQFCLEGAPPFALNYLTSP